jgi:hypothetical protein
MTDADPVLCSQELAGRVLEFPAKKSLLMPIK